MCRRRYRRSSWSRRRPPQPRQPPSATSEIDSPQFARIGQVAKREIAAGHVPGAVILVGHQGRIVYRRAFGLRAVEPCPEPMTVDTIFDLASLTKVVATTTAIMELVDQGRHQARCAGGHLLAGLRGERQGVHHHPAAFDAHLRLASRLDGPVPLVGL